MSPRVSSIRKDIVLAFGTKNGQDLGKRKYDEKIFQMQREAGASVGVRTVQGLVGLVSSDKKGNTELGNEAGKVSQSQSQEDCENIRLKCAPYVKISMIYFDYL